MKAQSHPVPALAAPAATKLFTAGSGLQNAALASPPVNNFG
jgi:hypothetical protein